jgi:phage recombination protein Bet
VSTAIQKQEPSVIDLLTTSAWPRAVLDVVRKLKVPKGCTDEEFYVFIKQCQKSGLDPTLGHAYCVPRRTKVSAKGEPERWVTNFVFQPAIDGMRARAAEFPDFAMSDSAAIYQNDLIEIDKGTGVITHKTKPTGQRGMLIGAWGRVRKKDGTAVVVELPVTARSGSSDFWKADQGGQLSKCAEAAALRKAYPVAFGGMYTKEEMPDEEPSRAEVMLSQPPAAPVQAQALPAATGPVMEFGEAWKGREVASLTLEEAREALEYGEWQLREYPKLGKKAKEKLQTNLEELRARLGQKEPEVEDAEEVPPTQLPITDPNAEPPLDVVLPVGDE